MIRRAGASIGLVAAIGCSLSSQNLGDLPSTTCDDPQARSVLDACFQRTAQVIDTSFEPLHMIPGDFDGDLRTDLLVVGVLDGGIANERFDGGPRGPEAPPSNPVLTGCSAYPVAGRVDGDQTSDVVHWNCATTIAVHWRGPDDMRPPTIVDVGLLPRSSVLTDLDGDGDQDLAVLGVDAAGTPALSIVLVAPGVDAVPVFAAPVVQLVGPLSFDPLGIHAGDLDGDGRIDLVIREGVVTPRIATWLANGPGTFEPLQAFELPVVPHALVLADIDGLGHAGLVYADRDAGRVCLLADLFGALPSVCIDAPGLRPTSLAPADFDDDGVAEIVVGDGSSPRLVVLARGDTGALEETGELPVPHPTDLLYVQDANGEGALDVIAGHLAARAFSIRLGYP